MDAPTLGAFARRAVADRVALVMTDENSVYRYAFGRDVEHEAINHSRGEYVLGSVHTDNIESFWSLSNVCNRHISSCQQRLLVALSECMSK
jgi:ISXO2 transposase-like protein